MPRQQEMVVEMVVSAAKFALMANLLLAASFKKWVNRAGFD